LRSRLAPRLDLRVDVGEGKVVIVSLSLRYGQQQSLEVATLVLAAVSGVEEPVQWSIGVEARSHMAATDDPMGNEGGGNEQPKDTC